MKVKYFKAPKDTHRFRGNQIVWIVSRHQNYVDIKFKWRGSGRYTKGVEDIEHVSNIKEIEVTENFFKFITG
jgi:hypothetical protein